jgi:hypothetical protein
MLEVQADKTKSTVDEESNGFEAKARGTPGAQW